MGIKEDVQEMKKRGLSDQDIKTRLQASGLTAEEINSSMQENSESFGHYDSEGNESIGGTEGMQQSILPPESMNNQNLYNDSAKSTKEYPEYKPQMPNSYNSQDNIETSSVPQAQESYGGQTTEYGSNYEDYQPYQSYSGGTSPDIIAEITDQILSEKLSTIRKNLERAIDVRNTIGTKIDYMEERLKRIEKIIDTLQSSVLRKVGDYVNDVQDIKKELIETEKTLSKILPEIKHKKSHKKN